eukprot:TRINITY_DN21874_c0_g2_i1.p1 TRINITY_DN21874_c0_g2~~TRINITY_DN21874_c0_g2_i1.p1  ORF type:complete len:496 (+),score=63.70 TRINITY_DN21874_c0_g2_i1:61-1488(+)
MAAVPSVSAAVEPRYVALRDLRLEASARSIAVSPVATASDIDEESSSQEYDSPATPSITRRRRKWCFVVTSGILISAVLGILLQQLSSDDPESDESDDVDKTNFEKEYTPDSNLKLLPLPRCTCKGKNGDKDAFKKGASPNDNILCMNPWGGRERYCFPVSKLGDCKPTERQCNNTGKIGDEDRPSDVGSMNGLGYIASNATPIGNNTEGNATDRVDRGRNSTVAKPKAQPCLCIFDIDRTLTAKQGSGEGERQRCPDASTYPHTRDAAYGSGPFTLSAVGTMGIAKTSCGVCYVGIISHGTVRGSSHVNRALLLAVLMTPPFARIAKHHPDALTWSYGSFTRQGPRNVHSPLVIGQPEKLKQWSMESILGWYASKDVHILRERVFFFDDKVENVENFEGTGANARQISCDSREKRVGFCGAKLNEIALTPGVFSCAARSHRSKGNGHPKIARVVGPTQELGENVSEESNEDDEA